MLDHSGGLKNAHLSWVDCFILLTAVGHVLQMSFSGGGFYLIGSGWSVGVSVGSTRSFWEVSGSCRFAVVSDHVVASRADWACVS
jgi:hypothetical protein